MLHILLYMIQTEIAIAFCHLFGTDTKHANRQVPCKCRIHSCRIMQTHLTQSVKCNIQVFPNRNLWEKAV